MVNIAGYAGNILYIDLSTGISKIEILNTELQRKFIGGWGFNNFLAKDLIKPERDPLSPENPLILGTGTLCGTLAPMSGKISLTMLLPAFADKKETHHAVATCMGGSRRFGTMLKCAGYDHVVITGRASAPCYIKIIDESVDICDASDLWGKDAYETSDILTERHMGRTGKCGQLAIGRAGENLVRWSNALLDKGASLGRGGGGALMGSKNLKGIVTIGTKGIGIADRKRFLSLVDEIYHEMKETPALRGDPRSTSFYGGGVLSKEYPREIYFKTRETGVACSCCLVPCKYSHEIKDGDFAGLRVPRLSYASVRDFGRRLRIGDYREMIKLIDVIHRFGLDRLTALKMVHFITSLYERGVISTKDTGGLKLKRGNFDAYLSLINKFANRDDIGQFAAEGWYRLSQKVGIDADADTRDGTPIVRGMDTVLDARFTGLSPGVFGEVVRPGRAQHSPQESLLPRGQDPQRDSYFPESKRSFNDIRREAERMGLTKDEMKGVFSSGDFKTGRLEKHAEDMLAVCDSLGVCAEGSGYWWPTRNLKRLAEFYSAATGLEMSPLELKKAGERARNIERLINVRAGFSRKDDKFPLPWLENTKKPVGKALLSDWFGRRLSADDLERILDEYYDERGWNIKTGIPLKKKLISLGLEGFAG